MSKNNIPLPKEKEKGKFSLKDYLCEPSRVILNFEVMLSSDNNLTILSTAAEGNLNPKSIVYFHLNNSRSFEFIAMVSVVHSTRHKKIRTRNVSHKVNE